MQRGNRVGLVPALESMAPDPSTSQPVSSPRYTRRSPRSAKLLKTALLLGAPLNASMNE
jgi:hypothetical protein